MGLNHFNARHFGQRYFAARHWGRLLEAIRLSLAGQFHILRQFISTTATKRREDVRVLGAAEHVFAGVSVAPEATAPVRRADFAAMIPAADIPAGEKPTTIFVPGGKPDLFATATAAGITVRNQPRPIAATTAGKTITVNNPRSSK